MTVSPLAGKPATREMLVDVAALKREYYARRPDPQDPAERVSFGTSGHRGSALRGSFNEAHILAMTQAICDYRRAQRIDGPLFLGKDTHALSGPAQRTALEVLAAQRRGDRDPARGRLHPDAGDLARHPGVQPGPHRAPRRRHRRDAVAQSAGGRRLQVQPAERRPRRYRRDELDPGPRERPAASARSGVKRVPYARVLQAATTHQEDFVLPYVEDLRNVVDMDAIRGAGLSLAVDPLGGAAVHYWEPINRVYGLTIEVVNPKVDPTFSFMTVDHDGQIRMDCSSPYAMAGLVALKERYQRGLRQRRGRGSPRHRRRRRRGS